MPDDHDSQRPQTAEEWLAWDAEEKRRSEREQNERFSRILTPDQRGAVDGKLLGVDDFLQRPFLKIQIYRPVRSKLGVITQHLGCVWQDSLETPACGHPAAFMIVDTVSGRGAVLCHDHALKAALERKHEAQSARTELRAKRAAKKLENYGKRHGSALIVRP